MKRLPLLAVFVLFIALCVSAAYWAMQLFKPPVRPVAAPPVSKTQVPPAAAAGLFGGRPAGTAVASNFELRGVVVSGTAKESIAILAADGKPAQAIRVDMEILPGIKIKEVHPQYILLTEEGITKRVDLPESARGQGGVDMVANARTPIPVPGEAIMPAPAMDMQNSQAGHNPVVVNGMPNYNQQLQASNQPQQPQTNNQQPNGQPEAYQPSNMEQANSSNPADMNQPQMQSHSAAANMPAEGPNPETPNAATENPEAPPGFSPEAPPGFSGGQSGLNTR